MSSGTSDKKSDRSVATKPAKSGVTVKAPRKIKKPKYQSFRLQKRIAPQGTKLPSAFALMRQSLMTLRQNWKVFGMIVVLYAVVNFVVVKGFSAGINVSDVKETLSTMFDGRAGSLLSGLSLFVYMIGTSGTDSTGTAGAYQFTWMIVVSLAIIWGLRQAHANKRFTVRDAFYGGMYPFIPFILVLLVVALQFLPAILGGILYTSIVSGGIAATAIESLLWGLIFAILIVVSLYMLTAAIFALYIVCLPDMRPMKALRSARELVVTRRWTVVRKLAFLPLFLLIAGAIIVVPFIIFAAPVASWVFFIVSMLSLAVLHSYLYTVYRSLL